MNRPAAAALAASVRPVDLPPSADPVRAPAPLPGPSLGARPRRAIAEIEVLRGIAILMVLVEHAPINLIYWSGPLFRGMFDYAKGWTGVDLFFAISGFVITRSLLPDVDRTRLADCVPLLVRFWIRRAWRLLPSAWLWLAVPLALSLAFNHSGAYRSPFSNLETGVAGFLDLENFHEVQAFGRRENGLAFPYWSLSLEEQFYLILPLALLVLRGWILLPIAAILLHTAQHASLLDNLTRGGALSLGVLLALWELRSRATYVGCMPASLARHRVARIACLVVPLGCLVVLGSDRFLVTDFRLLPVACLAGFLVWLASYDEGLLWQDGRARRVMVWIGERSYAIYLVHITVYATAHELYHRLAPRADRPHGWEQAAYLASTLAAVLVVAHLNHVLLEKPLRERGRLIAASWSAARGGLDDALAVRQGHSR